MKDKSLTRVSVFLTSQIISLFGSAIVSYSIVWYITLKTSSTSGLAGASGWLPAPVPALLSAS